MLDAGMTAGEVATKLKRTRLAIYARLQHLYRKRYPAPSAAVSASLDAIKQGRCGWRPGFDLHGLAEFAVQLAKFCAAHYARPLMNSAQTDNF
jgi:hypothetical protein